MPQATAIAPRRNTCAEPRRSIPDAVIRSLKQRISILTLAERYGVKPVKVGNGYKAICPFHKVNGRSERTPSLSLSPEKNQYHCFSCNKEGDSITWVMELDNLDFLKAVEKLLALAPVVLKVNGENKESLPVKEKEPELSEDQRQAILAEVVRRSVEDLRNSDGGHRYLESRGLEPLQLLESYTFGFWNGKTFDKLESSGNLKRIAPELAVEILTPASDKYAIVEHAGIVQRQEHGVEQFKFFHEGLSLHL